MEVTTDVDIVDAIVIVECYSIALRLSILLRHYDIRIKHVVPRCTNECLERMY